MTAEPANQNAEQLARDAIDRQLAAAGWVVQKQKTLDFNAGPGIAVREYQTDVGPADYVLFVDRQPLGVIEAKPEDWGHKITTVELQAETYAAARLKWLHHTKPLPFVYECTGVITRFTDARDPKPRSREVFSVHRPETLAEWAKQPASLRARLGQLPTLITGGLRDCQVRAIINLEDSLKAARARALVQMATGAGKTFTAISAVYRLLKFGDAKRVLFLVDTRNLGEQAEQEFMAFVPNDDNRKFTELYNVQRLSSGHIARDSQVCISTIQRMYALLKDQSLDEAAEETNPAEQLVKGKQPLPVVYNPWIPPEFFDVVIIDECHRSIYNLWRQVLEYFDAFLVGLTATPDSRTYGFFHKNVVSEYPHEQAVADGVNVGNEVFEIETGRTREGAVIKAKQQVERRERLTRRRRWEMQDADETYTAKDLDRSVVNPDQIRTVISAYRDSLARIFPGRREVPKTLIFAKTDSHADDIIQIVREVFDEGNAFCKKVTYRAARDRQDKDGGLLEKGEDPKSILAQFRNAYHPRIAVTVDMIATGTDVKPLECLIFMRDVRSRNYFEQMKGRGTRTLDADGLKKVTPSACTAKTHYVIVDAVGVTRSLKTASRPLITKPSVPLKDLATGVMMGVRDEDSVSSLAGRLARLDKQLDDPERARIQTAAGGTRLTTIVRSLVDAIDPDRIEERARIITGSDHGFGEPGDSQRDQARDELVGEAARIFTGPLIELLDSIRRDKEQIIDHDNLDNLVTADWAGETAENAAALRKEFAQYLSEHRDQIEALSIFFTQPARRAAVTYGMIQSLLDQLRQDRPKLAPLRVWQAYSQLDQLPAGTASPISELTTLVALIRRVCGIDQRIAPYDDTVRRNFQNWIMRRHSGAGEKFNEEQMAWLRMIRDHVAGSFRFERDDLELAPFDGQGGIGRMYQLFGEGMDEVIEKLNEVLAA
ncbi:MULTISPECIES: type I restriction endonuclease subunit R [Thiorhodovibrio]|uniref:type I restriction endonuclease subunit R n=1 Tax=Thiorhodovibrio TaxID=61593 RepID=UPI0019125CD2|nr:MULTISPECIES: DEAD/DEAH box helicase family protein [Thiorhodovibrio]MBK5970391.1 restriction endonuclease subunit R [Thiorhodovibrio winogradskyi]WPL14306.1 Type-1 restriction enzyme R protein [Thiorhodovibrio litoralis]